MKRVQSFFCILILVFNIVSVFAQKNANTEIFLNIEGTVVENKNPVDIKAGIAGAKVILMDKNYKIILSKYTNKQGKFSLQALPNTQYFVIAEKKEYASKRISVTTAATFDASQDQIAIPLYKSKEKEDDRTEYLQKVVSDANDLPNKNSNTKTTTASNTKNETTSNTSTKNNSAPAANANVVFKIQFGKFANPAPVKFFAQLQGVEIFREEGFIVYTIGNYRTLFEANAALNEIKAKGYSGSFVTAYLDNQKISTTDAAAIAPKR